MRASLLILFAGMIALSGCASSDPSDEGANGNHAGNTGSAVSGTDPSLSNEVPNANGIGESPPGSIADRMEKRAERIQHPSKGPKPPMSFRKAPEDSEFGTTMLEDGSVREVRVFKKHSTLASVESIAKGPNDRILKFVFKNGQVREIRSDQITDLFNAKVSRLVEIAESGPVTSR